MSCELKLLAGIDDLQKCRQYLFAGEPENDTWLQKCIVALSPTMERVVIAYSTALVVFTTQADRLTSSTRLVVSCQWDSADHLIKKEEITSVACLPLVAVGNHSHGGPDWTCIAVGCRSGCLLFFTENMDLITANCLHPEPVLHIKAVSHRKRKEARSEGNESTEAVYAVYPTVLCFLPGFSLFQTLRGCRSKVASAIAKSTITTPDVTLDVKKYLFPTQPVSDACFLENSSVNNFDHLLAASQDGFYSNYRHSPHQHTLLASTGTTSWLQFQKTTEGVTAPLELANVAKTVLTSLPSWFGLGSKNAQEPVEKPAEKLAPRNRLLDRRREGRSISTSPDGSLLVVSDSLGRVTLVDVRSGIAIRMWKGYRDAECGFLELEEEIPKARHRHKHHAPPSATHAPRRITLLAIHAPKKCIVELFPLRHGPRIAAITVKKNSRLIFTPHGLMGFSTVPRKIHSDSVPVAILCEDGVMNFLVPFHCALFDSSALTKDVHALKELKVWLKQSEHGEDRLAEEVTRMARKLTTNEVRLQTIDLLSSLKVVTPNVLCSVLDVFLEVAQDTDVVSSSPDQRNLLTYSNQLRKIVLFHNFLQSIETAPKEQMPKPEDSLENVLFLSTAEITTLLEFMKHTQHVSAPKREARVGFHLPGGQSLPFFLQSLDLSDDGPYHQKPNLSEEDHRLLGEFIFSSLSQRPLMIEVWIKQARLSNISPFIFARCLLAYWLQRPVEDLEKDMRLFVLLLKSVSSLSDEPVASAEYNLESPWWTELRSVISSSRKAFVALMIAVCCRAVSLQCEKEGELYRSMKENKDVVPDYDWENVSVETWQWDSIISYLEDIAVLNTVLSVTPSGRRSSEQTDVSLSELMGSGEGGVSERTAKWLLQFDFSPHLLINKSDVEFQSTPPEPAPQLLKGRKILKGDEGLVCPLVEIAEEVQPGSELESTILGHLQLLKKRFPYSLTSSTILSYLGWQLLSNWRTDLSNVKLLESAIGYLMAIPSAQLRAGVCSLAWNTYFQLYFERIARLVAKLGKVPSDILCTRELELPRDKIAPFLNKAVLLLSTIMDALTERPQTEFVRGREGFWKDGPPCLATFALSRPPPFENMVLLHHQIATVFHMVAALELRDRPLFPVLIDSLKSQLFVDLTLRKDIKLHLPGLSSLLQKFLLRAVSAAVQTVHEVECDGGQTCLDSKSASYWLRICCDLATTWNLPLDTLRCQYVCELYSFGFDRLAEEALPAVNDTILLASKLLVIAGHRVKELIAASSAPVTAFSNLNPVFTSWLDSLNEEGIKESRSSVEDTEILTNRILQWLPESHADLFLATLLADNLQGLRS